MLLKNLLYYQNFISKFFFSEKLSITYLTNELSIKIWQSFSWIIFLGYILTVFYFFLWRRASIWNFIFRLYHLFRVLFFYFCFYTFHVKYNIMRTKFPDSVTALIILHLRHRIAFSVSQGQCGPCIINYLEVLEEKGLLSSSVVQPSSFDLWRGEIGWRRKSFEAETWKIPSFTVLQVHHLSEIQHLSKSGQPRTHLNPNLW